MKILIIAPYYHPYINPRAHRWTVLAEHWAKEGLEVHVVCSKHPDFEKEEKWNGVNVHRVGYNSIKEVFYNFLSSKNRRGAVVKQPVQPHTANRNYISEFAMFLNNKLLKPFYFPDDAFLWKQAACRKTLNLLATQHFDVLISVALPFTAHVVGLACKKRFPHLKWIADMGDPFALQTKLLNFSKRQTKRAYTLENQVLSHVSFYSLTNIGALRAYQQAFSINTNYKVIPPLSSFEVTKKEQDRNIDIDEKAINIGYFGSFFPEVREPDGLLVLFSTIKKEYPTFSEKMRLHFFGNIFENFLPIFSQYPTLQKHIIFHGMHQREQIILVMKQMDVLLNIGNKSTHQLPSKSVDYLFSGKPILNLCSIENDTFKAFFEEYPDILNVYKYKPSTANAKQCVQFIKKNKGKKVGTEELKKWTAPYELEAISKAYQDLFLLKETM